VKKFLSDKNFKGLNEKNNYGWTPFMSACYHGHKEIVEQLIKTVGFNSLNEKNNYGSTPFHWACHNGHEEVVKLLLTCSDIIISDNVDTKNKKIKKLIERYKKDPIMTRSSLILKEYIILYRHIVFLCDNYYKLNEKTENENGLRFTARKIIIFTSVILKIRTL
jgi:ankyrin repeat protein